MYFWIFSLCLPENLKKLTFQKFVKDFKDFHKFFFQGICVKKKFSFQGSEGKKETYFFSPDTGRYTIYAHQHNIPMYLPEFENENLDQKENKEKNQATQRIEAFQIDDSDDLPF